MWRTSIPLENQDAGGPYRAFAAAACYRVAMGWIVPGLWCLLLPETALQHTPTELVWVPWNWILTAFPGLVAQLTASLYLRERATFSIWHWRMYSASVAVLALTSAIYWISRVPAVNRFVSRVLPKIGSHVESTTSSGNGNNTEAESEKDDFYGRAELENMKGEEGV